MKKVKNLYKNKCEIWSETAGKNASRGETDKTTGRVQTLAALIECTRRVDLPHTTRSFTSHYTLIFPIFHGVSGLFSGKKSTFLTAGFPTRLIVNGQREWRKILLFAGERETARKNGDITGQKVKDLYTRNTFPPFESFSESISPNVSRERSLPTSLAYGHLRPSSTRRQAMIDEVQKTLNQPASLKTYKEQQKRLKAFYSK